jgi:stage IV sporulation protein FB
LGFQSGRKKRMKIKIDLKIFIFIIIFILTRQIQIYGILMLFAFIHELGHILAGIILGLKPTNLSIMPYGLSVAFETKCEDYNKKVKNGNMLAIKKIIIASAGPITNLIITIIFIIFNINFLGIQRELIVYSNILIGIFNLIPIYPLDGGRIIKNILHIKFGLKDSYKYTNQISKITICIITAVSSIVILYVKNIAILIILAYLWYLVLHWGRFLLGKVSLLEI